MPCDALEEKGDDVLARRSVHSVGYHFVSFAWNYIDEFPWRDLLSVVCTHGTPICWALLMIGGVAALYV